MSLSDRLNRLDEIDLTSELIILWVRKGTVYIIERTIWTLNLPVTLAPLEPLPPPDLPLPPGVRLIPVKRALFIDGGITTYGKAWLAMMEPTNPNGLAVYVKPPELPFTVEKSSKPKPEPLEIKIKLAVPFKRGNTPTHP